MRPPRSSPRCRRAAAPPRREAGAGDDRPPWGWRAHRATAFVNPRAPAVPATLALTRDEYFAAAALIGLLASQAEEPDREWACEWSYDMGRKMARAALRKRKLAR